MTTTQFLIDTPLAAVERTAPHFAEVHFKPGAVLTVAGIAAILTAREVMGRVGPHQALIVFPAEETNFDMTMITADHYKGRPVEEFTSSVAWVTRNEYNERYVRLYFSYFPSPVPGAISKEEVEARTWLQERG